MPGTGIPIEQAPYATDQALAEWLERQLVTINNALGVTGNYKPTYVLPSKPQPGHVYYFAAAVLPDILNEGLYVYLSTGWKEL